MAQESSSAMGGHDDDIRLFKSGVNITSGSTIKTVCCWPTQIALALRTIMNDTDITTIFLRCNWFVKYQRRIFLRGIIDVNNKSESWYYKNGTIKNIRNVRLN